MTGRTFFSSHAAAGDYTQRETEEEEEKLDRARLLIDPGEGAKINNHLIGKHKQSCFEWQDPMITFFASFQLCK